MEQIYSYSLDVNSHLINVKDAVKGNQYYCPCCGCMMIPRQGNIRQWHFAHKGDSKTCSYETYLHKIAKKRICQCFNDSSEFRISYHCKVSCSIKPCPLGAKDPCKWKDIKTFNLKEYYNNCTEEKNIGKYVADLLISKTNDSNRAPILVEICVTHKSTNEKLQSGYRIIEINIQSENDIEQIISTKCFTESDFTNTNCKEKDNCKIRFYNFNNNFRGKPTKEQQAPKYRFYVDRKNFYHNDSFENHNESIKCLTETPSYINDSLFLIESRQPIDIDFAFRKLSESGLDIKFCNMCRFYRYNNRYMRLICIRYKSKKTNKFPQLSNAMSCSDFKQINYNNSERIFICKDQGCKITY